MKQLFIAAFSAITLSTPLLAVTHQIKKEPEIILPCIVIKPSSLLQSMQQNERKLAMMELRIKNLENYITKLEEGAEKIMEKKAKK